jgi:hypothetical protein
MKSARRGKSTSLAEISNVSAHGLWLYAVDREYFISFETHPWFRNATIAQLTNVQLLHGHHLHWPDLDVDLEMDSLAHPERYPLTYRRSGST